MNNETIILDKIQAVAEEMAFMSVGTIREEKIKSVIILAFKLIKASKTDEIFNLLMQMHAEIDKK